MKLRPRVKAGMIRTLRVLSVEDSARDLALLTRHLSRAGYEPICERVDTPEAMRTGLETQKWDVILCDYSMPHFDALSALAILKESEVDVPFIIISGTVGEAVAVEAMRAGAHDYLMKDNLVRLVPTIEREMHEVENRRARRRAEEEKAELIAQIESQRQRLNTIIANIPGMVWEAWGNPVTASQRTDFVSDYVETMLGYSREEWLTTPNIWLSIVHEDDKEQTARAVAENLASGGAGTLEFRWIAKDGHVVWVETRYLVIRDGEGKPIGLRGVTIDITERKHAEEALRESEERYKGLIDSAFDGVVIMKDRIIMSANRASAEMFGYAVEELVGMDVLQLTSEGEFVRSKIASNETRYETIGLKKDGSHINIEVSAKVCLYEGKPARLTAVRDITDRKRAEEALRESEERYRDLVENARDIIYTHDLEGNYTSTNKAGEEITGYSQQESLQLNLAQTIAPEHLEKARSMLRGKLNCDQETVYDLELIAKDGHRIAVEVNTRLVFEGDVPVGVQGIARDITERKRAEAMQIRRLAQAALRGDINSALAESDTPLRRILNRCAEAMVQHLDAAFARIWTLNRNEEMLELQASAGMYTHLDGPHSRVAIGAFKIGRIAGTRQPHITNAVQSDPEVSDKEWAKRGGMISFAGYPLIVEDRLVGVMAMFARRKLADDTIDALASVADIISQGIERKRVEEALRASENQLRQSQKLEAVGQLAGGVAHDFNNLLTVINGYSDILLRQMSQGNEMRLKVEEIKKAGERAASLTRQLLAFSRKQVLQPKVLKLNAIVADTEKMLRRLIGEDIDLLTVLEPSLGQIKADPGQIEQVILNLAVNARDAMPRGGKLTLETCNVHLDNEHVGKHEAIRPGQYVMLAISDNGTGMDAETQARIFEPFFTTKAQGKGTGLGCSTVYGIVKQSEGTIWVYSEVGKGTTFKVYLPRVGGEAQLDGAHESCFDLPQGRENVLLTEDEEPVRRLTRIILEMNGYQVLEAANGDEALSIYKEHKAQLDLIITDVVMPRMSGPELAQTLETLSPGIKVLYLSGYTDDAIVRHGLLDQKMAFLQKPFTPDALLRKVREVLAAT
jgi:PAS domain S-box-containing protein